MQRILGGMLAGWIAGAGLAFGQATYRPADAPAVTADLEAWYQAGEPIVFAGERYYPAGPRVFFDSNTMVPAAWYGGVPVYIDTTLEPFSLVFVPLDGRQMQPYERLRTGDLAGTTGSRLPAFPGTADTSPTIGGIPLYDNLPQIAGPPTFAGAIGRNVPQLPAAAPLTSPVARNLPQAAVPTAGRVAVLQGAAPAVLPAAEPAAPPAPTRMETALQPSGTDGIWVSYAGARWYVAGPAVPLDETRYRVAGDYRGFPVYERRLEASDDRLYLPARPGWITPYRRR